MAQFQARFGQLNGLQTCALLLRLGTQNASPHHQGSAASQASRLRSHTAAGPEDKLCGNQYRRGAAVKSALAAAEPSSSALDHPMVQGWLSVGL
jgi:hypothetical protein